jgi:predicted branched-subunit amino acid permease
VPVGDSFRRGLRLGIPYAAVATVLAMSFGVLAVQVGLTPLQAIATSALVFGGSAQFAALAIIGAGGGVVAALSAATLMHSRFLAMGIALASSLKGGPLRRVFEGQLTVDSSWAMGSRGDGTFDRGLVFGMTAPQYVGWVVGTVLGVWGGQLVGDPERLGLDALFPTFFLGILIADLRRPRARTAAVLGGLVALALVPFTPPGVPVLAASAAALIGLARPDLPRSEPEEEPA